MAIRQEIFEYRPSGHSNECVNAEGNVSDYGRDMDGGCRECRTIARKVLVEWEGHTYAYVNWPGGRVEVTKSVYLRSNGILVRSVTHEGLVLATRERNYSDDSDFYALVWSPENGRIEEVGYATTRFGGTDDNTASADLADEWKADVEAYVTRRCVEAIRAQERHDWYEAAVAATHPHKGATVKVVKGRKVAHERAGLVIWTGTDNYGNKRVGVKDEAGEVFFTAASNVVVLADPDDLPYEADFRKSDEEVEQAAKARVAYSGPASAFLGATWIPRTGMVLVA